MSQSELTVAGLRDTIDKTEESGEALRGLLRRNEVLTEILKAMESEEDFAEIAKTILRETGGYEDLSNAHLLRLNPDERTVDLIAEWTAEPKASLQEKMTLLPREEVPFFTGRPYTVSTNSTIPDAFLSYFTKYGISAGIFLPVTLSGKVSMYACFLVMESTRVWRTDEIRFFHDVKRVIQTILVKRITRNSLASSYHTLESILENVGCGIVVIDPDRKDFLYTNEMYKVLVKTEDDELSLRPVLLRHTDEDEKRIEYHDRKNERWYELTFEAVQWVDGRSVRLCTLYDITDNKRYQKRIEHQAELDYLTDLFNRKKFEKDLAAEVRNAARTGAQGAMFYIDLDDFKNINDGLGNSVGDGLLRAVARELQKIAGLKINVYRAGGDEFALIIPSTENRQLDALSHKIQDAFTTPWQLGGSDYYCTMSMGVVFFPKDGTDVDQLMQRADFALRAAKKTGKNHQEYYSENADGEPIRRLDMERALREAVEDDCREFEVYYQPIVDVSREDHPCIGAEALVRWHSKKLGLIMPGDFVPLAEYLGLILPIGKHVLNTACRRCKFWNDFGHPEYIVHVNLSLVQLVRENIVDTVRTAIRDSGIDPKNLTLEVTEGLAVQDMDAMNRILRELKEMGTHVALDDFGTGYSSLSYIRDMPLDVIKIDKSFINNVGQDEFSDAFVKTVSSLADTLSMGVVVEGVEKETQKAALKDMHVSMIQGYLYDKPLPQEAFEKKYLA